MIGFAVGSILVGTLLARLPVRRKARASMLAWLLDLPAYLLLAVANSVRVAFTATGSGAAEAPLCAPRSAAQETIPDAVLGRVLGVISFVHRGSHATGLLLVAPIFAIAAPRPIFAVAAIAVAGIGLAGAAVTTRLAGEARLEGG